MAKLKSITNKIQTAVIVVLVTMLSLVFVLEFGGPQSQGCAGGGGTYAAKVAGQVITEGDFDASYTLGNFNQQPPETQRDLRLKEMVLQGLIERALLAREARRLGFEVTEEDVWRHLGEEGTIYYTLGVGAPAHLPQGELAVPVTNEQGEFDTDQARRFIQFYLRRSVGEFGEAQVQEMLAERMRDVVRATVAVSPQEVWDAFVRDRERAKIAYIRFSPRHYRNRVEVTSAALEKWMEANADEVAREYQANQHRYTDLEKQVRARHILLQVPSDADEETRAQKREKAEELLAQVREGADFAALAAQESEDSGSAAKGGDLGWNPRGRMVPEFDEAQFALSPGEVSDVVETQFGFHIIRVEDVREGDVPEEEAKREIAEGLYREARAETMAREAAERALAELEQGVELDALDAELGGKDPDADEEDDRGPNAPKVTETDAFARDENPLPAGMDAGPLVKAVFEHGEEDPLPDEPLAVGSDWFVFRVLERTEATREDFTEDVRAPLYSDLYERKAEQALRIYVQRLEERAREEGLVRVNEQILSYGEERDDQGAS
ncbi:MAG: peptidylprolyl isomerase [Myxococcota bacterium]